MITFTLLGITRAYRLIPAAARGRLPYFGAKPSSSGLALAWLLAGGGLPAFWTALVQDECRLAAGAIRWGRDH